MTLLAVPLLLGACARFRAMELPAEPAHMRLHHEERLGLALAARILIDPLSVEHRFGPEVSDAGFIPVLVSIENRGTGSFEIERHDFHIVLENGERFDPVAPGEVFAESRRSKLRAYLLAPLVIPAILAARNIDDYNFDLARWLAHSSFPESLRVEGKDPPFSRAVFFRDPVENGRAAATFKSAALECLVESEGARPDQLTLAADGPKVGQLLTFTVALEPETVP
jgi:hypothetical protein